MTRIDVKALAATLGIVWGGGVLLLGWVASAGFGAELVDVIGSVYLGYEPGLVGGLVGGAWALVDGALGGAVVAWIYNAFAGQR